MNFRSTFLLLFSLHALTQAISAAADYQVNPLTDEQRSRLQRALSSQAGQTRSPRAAARKPREEPNMPLLQLSGVSLSRAGHFVFERLDWAIEPRERIGLREKIEELLAKRPDALHRPSEVRCETSCCGWRAGSGAGALRGPGRRNVDPVSRASTPAKSCTAAHRLPRGGIENSMITVAVAITRLRSQVSANLHVLDINTDRRCASAHESESE